ncbi:(E)-beta-farnesene synthase-like [Panicum miliaceum]|uniref:(E)-beta-farnesene synthase-like n=1 Tax=Panicum miliaceum TaxID=4540 RepID=A0A3L6TGH2_PANMI|nr:(E)-beta-farnesene synthase-like [Panicum miliaceum]
MATCGGSPVLALGSQQEELLQRKPRPYTPSIWGDFFLKHQPCTPSQLVSMKESARSKQEEVTQILLETSASSEVVLKLELVDTLQRIGVDYHYRKEIDELLRDIIHGAQHEESCDDEPYVVSLRFYLLRKHGYNVSSDVFVKFRDEQGNFSTSNDVKCLLALYDAAHLRTRGEEILDNAMAFTKSRLQSMMKTLDPELAAEVEYTLETSSYRRVERVEARRYISLYEKKVTRNDTILEFAKLDYNILQALYCEELKALTVWWKGLQSQAYARFARDRVAEMHFWMLGVVYEPHQSYARIVLTKWLKLVSLMDDFCDNYSTTEEYDIFISSLERWDKQSAEKLPAYMKALFVFILNTISDIVEELKLQKNKHAELAKELFIDMAKRYRAEEKWRDECYVPEKVKEHLQISVGSSACMHIVNITFILMGDIATREAIDWAFSYPEMIRAVCIVGRIGNDIVSHEREQVSKHVASTVQTCMKEYGITVDETNEKLQELIGEAWMEIVQGCLDKAQPMELLEKAVNVARVMDYMYKRDDAYTHPYSLKDTITSMYVNSV